MYLNTVFKYNVFKYCPALVIGPLHECSVSMHKSRTSVRHSRMNQSRLEEQEKREKERGKTKARKLMKRKAA